MDGYQLVFQNGKIEIYNSFKEVWAVITAMMENDDLVWGNLVTPTELIRVRKGVEKWIR